MKTRELKELKLTKNIIIPFPNFQQNTIISPTQMNDNFEEIEYAYNNLIDNHNGALEKINKVLSDLTSSDNEAIVNEQERIEAEEIRVNNEEERIANEEERKTEETKRIAMYNVHLNDEIRREQKHIQMVSEFDTKVGEVDTLISTKTEEYNSFVETKTEEYNTFVETKEVEIQNAINSIPPKSELIGEKGDKGDKGEKGDKGDRGEQGLQGIQGIQGLQGIKGDKGDKGEQGIQGLKGDKGDKGDRGEQGVKGDTPSITHLETSINNKIQEVETRFNALTSTQQQSSEVIDARDGETSLKARLDRDIEKAKQVYVNVEGSYISTDSSSGYAKDVEIFGNTIQSASNLADIRSVGDKVEGQELYEIPVLSRGKNLFDGELELGSFGNEGENVSSLSRHRTKKPIKVASGKTYTISTPNQDLALDIIFYNSSMNFVSKTTSKTFVTPSDCHYIKFNSRVLLENVSIQLEEGTVATPYEPYQEDKLTILSPTPLEKVGDVRDRIIEKDGVWGVEKNIGEVIIDDTFAFGTPVLSSDGTRFRINIDSSIDNMTKNILKTPNIICDKFLSVNSDSAYTYTAIGITQYNTGRFFICNHTNTLATTDKAGFISWIKLNNIRVKFEYDVPQFIPLPHDQQIKLRTFANKTNISFLTEIEGTIKAQVPKSLGATINTHTEQISNLNKELDRVKKLEESTVSTVETESDFTTVEATSNGYFEDVKLEGKTVVNIAPNEVSIPPGSLKEVCVIPLIPMKPNFNYTIKAFNVPSVATNCTVSFRTNDWKDRVKSLDSEMKVLYTTPSQAEVDNLKYILLNIGADATSEQLKEIRFLILEGDHTQNPPSYFEGLKSVGQDVGEIVVSSVKGDGNLFDGEIYKDSNKYWFIIRNVKNNSIYIDLGQTCSYFELYECGELSDCYIKYKDWKVIKTVSNQQTTTTTVNKNHLIIAFDTNFFTSSEKLNKVIVNKGDAITSCKEYQADKKRLLFYNEETQSWEKPVLREWDSIEKHANGKYYYHQRSGEVVLNGSENYLMQDELTNSVVFRYTIDNSYLRPLEGNNSIIPSFSDKFVCELLTGHQINITDMETIAFTTNYIKIRISKSKLSTQDVQGFKQWLQTNNVTVVYQLAQEKVYECTNIDLITYEGETNYVVESGAIVPKTTLKVHNNISNVVNILQEKVSLLEDKFIMGLKQVLAGDMYSLAELLYPEDFVSKEEPIDVPTLLI